MLLRSSRSSSSIGAQPASLDQPKIPPKIPSRLRLPDQQEFSAQYSAYRAVKMEHNPSFQVASWCDDNATPDLYRAPTEKGDPLLPRSSAAEGERRRISEARPARARQPPNRL